MALKMSTDLRDLIRDTYYPIGTLYTSNKNTNPSTFVGGTWVIVTNDYILNFITSGTGGGYTGNSNSASDNTTLTTAQIPPHAHSAGVNNGGGHIHNMWFGGGANSGTGGQIPVANSRWGQDNAGMSDGGHDHGGVWVANTGGGGAHNHGINLKKLNMYGWIRTA